MRTTVTLDAEADAIVRRLMRERGLTFKQALNAAIRGGQARSAPASVRLDTFDLGGPAVPLDKALRLAADLEDEELLHKLALRK